MTRLSWSTNFFEVDTPKTAPGLPNLTASTTFREIQNITEDGMRSIRFIQNAANSAARPISLPEFANALFGALGPASINTVLEAEHTDGLTRKDDLKNGLREHGGHTSEQHSIGLAVSGGVDSMALAALCSRLQAVSQNRPQSEADQLTDFHFLRSLKFRAFIVDHSLRPGSGLEAEAVSKVLEARDIETRILKINWPVEISPTELPNFETVARHHRFPLLGKACWDFGITSLLFGHHEDDQVETILMRLSKGLKWNGLRGIRKSGSLPASEGFHGLHESGGVPTIIGGIIGVGDATAQSSRTFAENQLHVEAGGIRVYRPFLDFSKTRLEATCLAENMQWFEDNTNQDATLTQRNAIRYICNNHTLPTAISKPVLLGVAKRATDRAAHRSEIMKSWLAKCQITQFETRSGTVNIRFADLNDFRHPAAAWPPESAFAIATQLVNVVLSLVQPGIRAQAPGNLYSAMRIIFPELYQDDEEPTSPAAFTVAGIQFRRSEVLVSNEQPLPTMNQKPLWILSRQVCCRPRLPHLHFSVPKTKGAWSPWELFDGRYWIRVRNLSQPVMIKCLTAELLGQFYASLADKKPLRELLSRVAPGDIRWTLPSILTHEGGRMQRVIGLPSLGVSSAGCQVQWEIRYKKIYTEDLPKDSSLLRTMLREKPKRTRAGGRGSQGQRAAILHC